LSPTQQSGSAAIAAASKMKPTIKSAARAFLSFTAIPAITTTTPTPAPTRHAIAAGFICMTGWLFLSTFHILINVYAHSTYCMHARFQSSLLAHNRAITLPRARPR
jgi:hypothetical protein